MTGLWLLCSLIAGFHELVMISRRKTYTVQNATFSILKVIFAPFWLMAKAMDWALKVDFLNWRIF